MYRLHLLFWVYFISLTPQLSGLLTDAFRASQALTERFTNNSSATKEILPVINNSMPVELKIDLSIRQISTVDEVNQAVRLNVWLRLSWINPFLTWNFTEYHNVKSLHVSNEAVWKPDLALYNKASLEEEIDILYRRLSTSIVVHHDGHCQWNAPATLLSQCKINVSRFPFDEQECLVTFGSWTYTLNEINVSAKNESAALKDFIPNGEWEIVKAPLIRNVKHYSNADHPDVTLHLRMRRRPLYYTLNLIVPCTVISVLAFLSFILPTNHGERVSLVITVLLAMSVYMLIVSSSLPQTSDAIPIIGAYFLCIIVEIALSLFATCFVAKLRDHEGAIPKWVDTWVNKRLARLLLMPAVVSDYDQMVKVNHTNGHSKPVELLPRKKQEISLTENDPMGKLDITYQKTLDKISDHVSVLAEDVNRRCKHQAKMKKWKRAARVLDRFFLVFFSLTFVITTAANFAR